VYLRFICYILGRVALVTVAAAYNHQTFPSTIGQSVGACVGLSVQCIVENGGSDPDAVWRHRSDWSRDEAGSGVWGSVYEKGYFWERIWCAIVTNGDFLSQRRDPFPKLLWPDWLNVFTTEIDDWEA